VLCVAAAVLPSAAAMAEVPGRPGELLVVFKDGTQATVADEAHDGVGADGIQRVDELGLDVVEVDDVDQAIAEYERRPEVAYVEVNGTVTAAATVDDPLFTYQWHLQKKSGSNKGTSNAEAAWSKATGKGVTVAVVDTGVRAGGVDLDAGRLLTGIDLVNGDTNASDDNGHGTHIAGTIAQSTDNGRGVAGVAPKAKILPVKVLDAAGAGTYSDVIEGILWAKDRADVVNLSLAGTTYSKSLCDAVAKAAKKTVVVAASGNLGTSAVAYPAACDKAIAVGAVRYDGQRAGYSNRGPELELVAPGGDLDVDQDDDGQPDGILQQTYSGGWAYTFYEGTSMAAAHVSGVAALVVDAKESADVRTILRQSARDLGSSGRDSSYGYGAVDAKQAVDKAVAKAPASSAKKDPVARAGYWLAAANGAVHAFGDVPALGGVAGGAALAGIEPTASGAGYWLLDEGGHVSTRGDARAYGSLVGRLAPGVRAVDIAATRSGKGYWILDSTGDVAAFGDAPFHGSIASLRRGGQQIGLASAVDIAATPSGKGYWILDGAGGIFAFGDGRFFGSVPGLRLAGNAIGEANLVGLAPTASGKGYWLADDQGGIFSFGDAAFRGSIPAMRLAGIAIGQAVLVAMTPTPSGSGYWLVDSAGGVFTFGDARFHGSMPGIHAPGPSVGIATSS